MSILKKIIVASICVAATACSIQAPPYQVSLENVQSIKTSKISPVSVGEFGISKKLNSISLRGSGMYSPIEKSYGKYLADALQQELKLAKLWSGVSSNIISGEILTNDIDISGFSEGTGEISAKFEITQNGEVKFSKVIESTITFDSSFVGAIAIPNGQNNYKNLVQSLIKNLFQDKDFILNLK